MRPSRSPTACFRAWCWRPWRGRRCCWARPRARSARRFSSRWPLATNGSGRTRAPPWRSPAWWGWAPCWRSRRTRPSGSRSCCSATCWASPTPTWPQPPCCCWPGPLPWRPCTARLPPRPSTRREPRRPGCGRGWCERACWACSPPPSRWPCRASAPCSCWPSWWPRRWRYAGTRPPRRGRCWRVRGWRRSRVWSASSCPTTRARRRARRWLSCSARRPPWGRCCLSGPGRAGPSATG